MGLLLLSTGALGQAWLPATRTGTTATTQRPASPASTMLAGVHTHECPSPLLQALVDEDEASCWESGSLATIGVRPQQHGQQQVGVV